MIKYFLCLICGIAAADTMDTHLIDIQQGGYLSDLMRDVRKQSFEGSDGTVFSMYDWYHPQWSNLTVDFLTEISPNHGLIWGISTGERAPKYNIAASLKLGILSVYAVNKKTTLSVRTEKIFGGRLKERICVADYGDIGGIQTVNCRLAASSMNPQETLSYLYDKSPKNRFTIKLSFKHYF